MTKETRSMRESRHALDAALDLAVDGALVRATLTDVSRVGAGVVLGRYLRPGREVGLRPEGAGDAGLWARVVWCRPTTETARFRAGLRLYRETPEVALLFAGVLAQARGAEGGKRGLSLRAGVWPWRRYAGYEEGQPDLRPAAQAR